MLFLPLRTRQSEYTELNVNTQNTELCFLLPSPRRSCFQCHLSVCLLVSRTVENYWANSHETWRKAVNWAKDEPIKFGGELDVLLHL